MLFFHTTYGLTIESDLLLPELPPAAARAGLPADLTIRRGRSYEKLAARSMDGEFLVAREKASLFWPEAGCFTLRTGREVEIEPVAGVLDATLRAFLLGPVLAIVLHQRGYLVLHASAVALRGADGQWSAVGFLGHSGEGKSTLAAALHARGHRVVVDDFIAVPVAPNPQPELSWTPPLIFPGFARLRLSPQALRALGHEADALPLLHSTQDRRVYPVEEGFHASSLPLQRLYWLQRGPAVCSQVLPPARAMVPLVQHSYCAGLLSATEAAEEFQQCGRLARHLAVCQLQRPRDLALLDQVSMLIEADHAGHRAQASPR